jgi:hypothetical protein
MPEAEDGPLAARTATAIAGGGGAASEGPAVGSALGPQAAKMLQGLTTFGGSKMFEYYSNLNNSVFTCGVPQATPGYCG